MDFDLDNIESLNTALSEVIDGRCGALTLIDGIQNIIPFTAALCVINRRDQQPIYLGDTYRKGAAKEAVQRYVESTYLLNPVYNAFLAGLKPGLHLMADLAPDDWQPVLDPSHAVPAQQEEIGYRTLGWPEHLHELALTVDLPNGNMGEISLARPASDGGFSPMLVKRLQPFYPILATAFRHLCMRQSTSTISDDAPRWRLEDFTPNELSKRESEVVQMVLKGHSNLSIGLRLGIALPTVKTHRKNAYAKLGINTQQQLFNAFLQWQTTTRQV